MDDGNEERTVGASETESVYFKEVEGLVDDVVTQICALKLSEVATTLQKIVCGAGCRTTALRNMRECLLVHIHTKKLRGALENVRNFIVSIKFQSKCSS